MNKPLSFSGNIKDFNDLHSACNHFGIEINNNQLSMFKKYYETLIEWNEKINLVSRLTIKNLSLDESNHLLEKHFLDSILFLPEIVNFIASSEPQPETTKKEPQVGARTSQLAVFDIGSGGGFPAIPLAIMKPGWHFNLCESTKKKALFLQEVIKILGLEDSVKVTNERVEAINNKEAYKNKFNIVTSRAVSSLEQIIKYSLPLINKTGFIAVYKAKNIDNEAKHSNKLIDKNRLTLKIFSKQINSTERKLVVILHSF